MALEVAGPPARVLSTTPKAATTTATITQSHAQRRASLGDGRRATVGGAGGAVLAAIGLISVCVGRPGQGGRTCRDRTTGVRT
jgi:hypothetical protein